MNRIIGALFSGFACKVYAAGFAIWMAWEAATFIGHVAHSINKGFGA